ncbi:hypothetical protein BO70DRAFT_82238 [Aspergillus heteromorphus CBS 117.55]|uniref:Methylated-DNA--protein-cysteine methyltransferase n=1 Tax=Aspergillus heteromorphus CBS 117.55 TaxID=1448321 RepID=A0A317WX28_9EURO|nr:uncharacterized protein BO70DRAFT_82238 [Aspergillus heteromorphus CBS 117.55]PWY90966.1 hypothetical protein BO70DRAFT_82238 [Aspergillus heteromorphus CBS 117.55]
MTQMRTQSVPGGEQSQAQVQAQALPDSDADVSVSVSALTSTSTSTTNRTPTPISIPSQPQKPTPSAFPTLQKTITKIKTHATLPHARRKIYLALLSVPRGRWTTYAALAKHLGTSPRAIGAAMRMNPFAPEVPCHRVLGGGGKLLVGYSGTGGGSGSGSGTGGGKSVGAREGRGVKREMLEEEGVVFSEEGWARGVCFEGFGDLKK